MASRDDPARLAIGRLEPTPEAEGSLRVVVYLDRLDLVRLNTARRRGKIGRDAFDRLVSRLGHQVLQAVVAEELGIQ